MNGIRSIVLRCVVAATQRFFLWMKIAREAIEGQNVHMSAEYQGCAFVCTLFILLCYFVVVVSLFPFWISSIHRLHRNALMFRFFFSSCAGFVSNIQWHNNTTPFVFAFILLCIQTKQKKIKQHKCQQQQTATAIILHLFIVWFCCWFFACGCSHIHLSIVLFCTEIL